MRRSYWGGAMLALLLILGLVVTWAIRRSQEPVARDLREAADAILQEDWPRASRQVQTAEARWQNCWQFSAAVSDHAPMESIDNLFARLDVSLQRRDTTSAAALCSELAKQVESIAEAHRPSWWNLL